MGKEEAAFLIQLVNSLKESELKLEEYYEKRDYESFNHVKKLMLAIQKKIYEVVNDV